MTDARTPKPCSPAAMGDAPLPKPAPRRNAGNPVRGARQRERQSDRRTGRLDAPSMPVSSSASVVRPPQLSWRMRARTVRSVWCRHFARVSLCITTFPQRSHSNAQKPRREGCERLRQGLGRRGQRVGAIGPPVPRRPQHEGHVGAWRQSRSLIVLATGLLLVVALDWKMVSRH